MIQCRAVRWRRFDMSPGGLPMPIRSAIGSRACGLLRLTVCCLLAMTCSAQGATRVLFDGSLSAPTEQGWVFGSNPFFGSAATRTATDNGVELNTVSVLSEQAGFFSRDPLFGIVRHPGVMTLDRIAGYAIDFELQVVDEQHLQRDDNGDGEWDRAGVSLIVISDDHRGLEIGFWQDRVWMYDDDASGTSAAFTQAESADRDTTILTEYQLQVLGGGYRLLADGELILDGRLRNYQFFAGSPDVYEIASFLFLGDDTASASSVSRWNGMAIRTDIRSSPCDVNVDQFVDASDASRLFEQWGTVGMSLSDVNLDLVVDAADAGVCFADWSLRAEAIAIRPVPAPRTLGWTGLLLATSSVLLTRLVRRPASRIEGQSCSRRYCQRRV